MQVSKLFMLKLNFYIEEAEGMK